MGHKEELLKGAKETLLELGFSRTTARDIVARSGTNLGSIGYHFGTKDELMLQAMVSAMEDWGSLVASSQSGVDYGSSSEKFTTVWSQIIQRFHSDRPLMIASLEALIEAEHNPPLKQVLSSSFPSSSADLPDQFLIEQTGLDADTRDALGKVLLALISGILTQYIVDPASAPKAKQIALGIQALGRALKQGENDV